MARSLEDHLFAPGKKRILALDGGGARGILSCGILKRIETILASRLPMEQRKDFRLHQYFDLIGGTSTGSILAAGLAMGLSVDDLEKLYLSLCPKIFQNRGVAGINKPRFVAKVLAEQLDRVLREQDGRPLPMQLGAGAVAGSPITLGSSALHTGLAVFAKRINTGSSWTLTNNPRWRYFDKGAARAYAQRMGQPFDDGAAFNNNAAFPLARLVQASAAAPTYFETVGLDVEAARREGSLGLEVSGVDGVFVDGALSGRNTPALQMLMMVRHPAYGFEWAVGEDDLLMISVGTGWWRPKVTDQTLALRGNLAREALRAVDSLQTLIHDSSLAAITTLQSLSRTPLEKEKRWRIDGEVDDLLLDQGRPFLMTKEPLLRFRRMDVRLEDAEIKGLLGGRSLEDEAAELRLAPKFSGSQLSALKKAADAWGVSSPLVMRARDMAENDVAMLRLHYRLGEKYAERFVDEADFPREFDPPEMGAPDGSDTATVVEPPSATGGFFGFGKK